MHAIGLDGSAGIVAEQLLAGMLDALVVASMSLLILQLPHTHAFYAGSDPLTRRSMTP